MVRLKKIADSHQIFLPDFCSLRMVFVVVIIAELFAFVVALSPLDMEVASRWQVLGLTSLFVQWIALTSSAVLCLMRPYICHLSNTHVAAISYLIILTMIALITELAYRLVGLWPAAEHASLLFRNIVIGGILAGPILRYFYVQHQWQRRVQAESAARLQALQSRIRPHFFFNSMNTIASLTRLDPAKAEMAVENLADLFRVSLGDASKQYTFADELDLCRRYLEIEALRLGDRLQIDWRVETVPNDALLPPLLLQPLLENAIYHGIETMAEGGTVSIVGACLKRRITLTIKNPLLPDQVRTTKGNALALDNIRERLQVCFDNKASLTQEFQDHMHVVTMEMPYRTRLDEDTDR